MWSGYYYMHMPCLLFILAAVQVTVWKMAVSNILRPCLWRFITLHHDPLAQQTSCLKCLSGLTLRVWIPEFVCYVICLRERCGLSFFFLPPLPAFNSMHVPEVVCLHKSMYPLQISLWSAEWRFRLRWICMVFELGHVQIGKKKIDSHVLCTCPSGSERLWKHVVSTSQTTAASCFICGLCRYFCVRLKVVAYCMHMLCINNFAPQAFADSVNN